MISLRSIALVLSATALSACISAPVSAKGSTKPLLQAIYNSRDTAFLNKNISGTLAPYTAEAVIIDANGNQVKGLAAQREDLAKLFASDAVFSSPETEIEEFVAGKTSREATVKVTRHITVTAKSGSGNSSVVEEVVRDHWVQNKEGWHITQERRLTQSPFLEMCSAAVAGPSKNKIVGKWVGYLPSRPGTTAQMSLEFKEDGTELQTIVAPRQNISLVANYVAKDNVLTETLVSGMKNGRAAQNAGQVQTFHYHFDGDTLLVNLGGASDELRFTRQPN